MGTVWNKRIMYTDTMRKAFLSIRAPKNFSVEIFDNKDFLVLKADAKQFINLYHDDKIEAVRYMVSVKKALEENGAIVIMVRGELENE